MSSVNSLLCGRWVPAVRWTKRSGGEVLDCHHMLQSRKHFPCCRSCVWSTTRERKEVEEGLAEIDACETETETEPDENVTTDPIRQNDNDDE